MRHIHRQHVKYGGYVLQTVILVVLLQFSVAADPVEDVVYFTDSGYAEFTSSVPLHTFTGKSNHLTGMIDLEENVIDFYLDLNTLETGIGRRDRDMNRTLNVSEHPFAEFTGSLKSSFDEQSTEKQTVVAAGEFTINGVTRTVEIEGNLQKQGDDILLEAEWDLFIDDYNIEPPGILFYRVNTKQEVRIEAVLKTHDKEEITNNQ